MKVLAHHVLSELAMELERRGLAFTGTVHTNRRGMPLAIKCSGKRGMARGSVRAYHAGKAMAMQWQDKRTVTILSTTGSCNLVQVKTRRGVIKEKPEVVELYNQNMLGVDKNGPAGHLLFLPQEVCEVVEESYVLAVGGVCGQFLHRVHHTWTVWTTAPQSPSVPKGVNPTAGFT